MNGNSDVAWGWIRKGDNDLRTARQSLALEGPYDTACFHCQQAVEKYLKAVLALHGRPVPRTHDLRDIHLVVVANEASLSLGGVDLSSLTPYAVEVRYDFEFMPECRDLEDALRVAERVRSAVVAVLPTED